MVKKKNKTQELFDRIDASITPERKAEMDAMMDAHIKWMDEHPDYNERYGTDKSYWLEQIKAKGFNPVGITVMLCEETIIMETKEEIDKAWEIFKPEGWWYTVDQWEEVRADYVKDYKYNFDGVAPKVYCMNNKYKDILK